MPILPQKNQDLKFNTITKGKANIAFHADLQCGQCQAIYPIEEQILYTCPKEDCGALLEIKHDITKIKQFSTDEWLTILQERRRATSASNPLYSSGVWNKKEWVLPHIKTEHIVSLGEGNSPLISLEGLAGHLGIAAVWLKQCGISHSGSFKDLGMTVLVSHVKSLQAQGHPIYAIACASTGDTSAALAAYGSYAGIPTIVFLPAGKVTTAQLVQPLSSGSLVLSLNADFDGCMKIIQEITADKKIYLANSMNPLRLEGQKTMGIEVLQQLDWQVPDWFIIPGGNLGNVSALVAGMQLMHELGLIQKMPRVCVAQSAHANPLYLSFQNDFRDYQPIKAKKTLASAIQIGAPVSYKRAVKALKSVDGIVEQASEEELSNASAYVDRYGMFTDPHTGVVLACLEKLCQSGQVSKSDQVVVISTAHGLKFSDSKINYHEGKLDLQAKHRNTPIVLEADTKKVIEAIADIIEAYK